MAYIFVLALALTAFVVAGLPGVRAHRRFFWSWSIGASLLVLAAFATWANWEVKDGELCADGCSVLDTEPTGVPEIPPDGVPISQSGEPMLRA